MVFLEELQEIVQRRDILSLESRQIRNIGAESCGDMIKERSDQGRVLPLKKDPMEERVHIDGLVAKQENVHCSDDMDNPLSTIPA